MPSQADWDAPDEFDTIVHANKPFSLRVPALVVSRAANGVLNIMMAMWFTPMGTSPSTFIVAVSRTTKTYENIMDTKEFVIAVPDETMSDVALYAGYVSGFAEDKWTAAGLTPLRPNAGSVPLVREALANVELDLTRTLPYDDHYDLVVGTVRACHVKRECFRGGIYRDSARPLLWMGKESGLPKRAVGADHYVGGLGKVWAVDDSASPLLNASAKPGQRE